MKKLLLIVIGLIASISLYGDGANLSWDCNTESDLAGYRLYQGIVSHTYTSMISVPVNCSANRASYLIPSLNPGTYFWAVSAYDTSNNESGLSNEATKTIAVPSSLAQFNFTTPTGPTIAGYTNNSGAGFSSSLGYGWSTGWQQVPDSRVRGNTSVDPKLDSFVFCGSGGVCTFTYNAPNGNYLLTFASGDDQYAQGPHKVTVNGQIITNNVPTNANQWITQTDVPVTVSNGTIQVALGGSGAGTTCLNYLIIKSGNAPPPPDTTPPTQPTGLTIQSVSIRWNASADNIAVTGYKVLDNGNLVTQTTSTSAVLALSSGTHSIAVQAFDAAGNLSPTSTILPITVP